jgi:hypothetical protein
MGHTTVLIAVVLFIIVVVAYFTIGNREIVYIDGFAYTVNEKDSGTTLSSLNALAVDIIRLMRERVELYDSRDQTKMSSLRDDNIRRLRDMYRLVRNRYNPDGIEETSPIDMMSQTSYTDNKGERLVMCLKCQKCRKDHSKLTLALVLAHELAHMATEERQHPPEFWKRYDIIRDLVAQAGLFKHYKVPTSPVEYCGRIVIQPFEYRKIIEPRYII